MTMSDTIAPATTMTELANALSASKAFHESLDGFLTSSSVAARDKLCDSLCELLESLKAAFATLEHSIAA